MSDWATRFALYVDSCARRQFRRGDFDCLVFANEAIREISGVEPFDDVIGCYAIDGKLRSVPELRRFTKCRRFIDYIDSKLPRIDGSPTLAPRGSLVAFPTRAVPYLALGIAFGNSAVTVARDHGTDSAPLGKARAAWAIEYV